MQITSCESLYAKERVWRNYLQVFERRIVLIRTIFDVQNELAMSSLKCLVYVLNCVVPAAVRIVSNQIGSSDTCRK